MWSLKSLAKRLKPFSRCLWSDVRLASIKPMVKTAPTLKTNREIIISSSDQEPPKINLISWYAKKIPKMLKRIANICSNKMIDLFSILTANLFFNQPDNKKDYEQETYSKQPIKGCSLFHRINNSILNYKKLSLKNSMLGKAMTLEGNVLALITLQ